MQDYIIATSSTSDLTREYLDEHRIPFVSYTYTVGDTLYEDDCREETRDRVYKGMRGGDRLKTSMINEFIYCDFFRSLLETGKDVIFLDMSVKMSVSFENCKKAAESIRTEYPGQELYVMDTRCISGGLGLLVMKMVELKEQGADFDTVIRWGEENKLKIAHRFTVDDLNYLKRGGRVGAVSAYAGALLGIKPVMHVSDEGKLVPRQKLRGYRQRRHEPRRNWKGSLRRAIEIVQNRFVRKRKKHVQCPSRSGLNRRMSGNRQKRAEPLQNRPEQWRSRIGQTRNL